MPDRTQSSKSLALLLALTLGSACSADTAPAPATTAPSTQKSDTVQVTINKVPFALEVADTPAKQELGLMNRTTMDKDHGMLFVFDAPGDYAFWMKNTLIGLDIIYLASDGTVVDIHTRKPLDETPMGPAAPAQFVIELNSGRAAAIGLTKGTKIELPPDCLKRAGRNPEK